MQHLVVTLQTSFLSRVHTFGVGENVSKRLIRGIAKAGRGIAEYIATGERMQSKVSTNMFKSEESISLLMEENE